MELYLPGGWLDVDRINAMKYPFVFVYGGRGIGKTFGEAGIITGAGRGKTLFLRRTKTEYDIITSNEMNTFSDYNVETGHNLKFDGQRGFSLITEGGETVGLCAALSTFSNLRGGGFEQFGVDYLLYDEFIPERHKSKIRNEADVLMNIYETINRNRELKGREPLKMRCFANSNDIRNPIFIGLGLVSLAEKMLKRDAEMQIDAERGVVLIDCRKSPISRRKAETALYRLSAGSDFFNMAIKNEFNSGLFPSKPKRLIEYRPIVSVGEIGIYQHKSKKTIYVSAAISPTAPKFSANDTQLEMFRMRYDYLYDAFYSGIIDFESNISQLLFLTYFKII
mgnify:CR=1 FL=1